MKYSIPYFHTYFVADILCGVSLFLGSGPDDIIINF